VQRILVPSPSFVKVAISSLVIWLCIPVSLIFGQIVPVSRAAGADIYVFHSSQGGQITGEWLNPKESPRQTYQVRTAEGVVVTLDRAQVSDKPVRQKPVEIEYEKLRPQYPNTVEGQWAIAEWCRERSLAEKRRAHLERILELDPNHVKARHALGYSQINGHWTTPEQMNRDIGYRLYEGKYRSEQEIQSLQGKKKQQAEERKWMQNLDRWLGWLQTNRAGMGEENIRGIQDPMAVRALCYWMKNNSDVSVRLMLTASLAKISTPAARSGLAYSAVFDEVEEVRLSCLDFLKKTRDPEVVDYFCGRLRGRDAKDNGIINRAAFALGEMGDPSAIGPLIDVLWTTHRVVSAPASNGQYQAAFPTRGTPGGSGLVAGGDKPQITHPTFFNPAVHEALVKLSRVDYGDDTRAWKSWHLKQRSREPVDTRRGNDRSEPAPGK
jgi:hypothetical protein